MNPQDQEGQGYNRGLKRQQLGLSIPPAFLQKREKDSVCLFICRGRQGHEVGKLFHQQQHLGTRNKNVTLKKCDTSVKFLV